MKSQNLDIVYVALVGIVVFLFYLFVIFKRIFNLFNYEIDHKAKEIKGFSKDIKVEFASLSGIGPIEAAFLVDRSINLLDLFAWILELVRLGWIKLVMEDNKISLIKAPEWGRKKLNELNQKFVAILFSSGDRLGFDELIEKLNYNRDYISRSIKESLRRNGYITSRNFVHILVFATFIIALLFAVVFLPFYMRLIFLLITALFIYIIMLGSNHEALTLNDFTGKGVDTRNIILGYRNYIEKVEFDRLNFSYTSKNLGENAMNKELPFSLALHIPTDLYKYYYKLFKQFDKSNKSNRVRPRLSKNLGKGLMVLMNIDHIDTRPLIKYAIYILLGIYIFKYFIGL